MANVTIPNLPQVTATTDLDILVLTDSGETTTSKITLADLLDGRVPASLWIEGSGTDAVAHSSRSATDASGDYSFVGPGTSSASGIYNFTTGYNNTTSGNYSIALGDRSNSNSWASIAMGRQANATGVYATVAGGRSQNASGYGFCGGGDGGNAGSTSAVSLGSLGGGNVNQAYSTGINMGFTTLNTQYSLATQVGSVSSSQKCFIQNGSRLTIINGRQSTIEGTKNFMTNSDSSTIGSSYSGVTMLGVDNYTAQVSDVVIVPGIEWANYSSFNYADDTAAAAGGVVLGQVYHNAGALRVRIS